MVAAGYAWVVTQGQDQPQCPNPDLPCVKHDLGLPSAASLRSGGVLAAVSDAAIPSGPPFADLTTYTDSSLGFSFQYGDPWSVDQQGDGIVLLTAANGNVALIIEGVTNDVADAQQILDFRHGKLDQALFAMATDDKPAHRLLGNPILGHKVGIAGLFGASFDTAQGPSADATIASVGASDGTISVVATLISPTQGRGLTMGWADQVIDTFTWPSDEVPQ